MIPKITRDYIMNLLLRGKRTDGRGPEDRRELKIEKNIIGPAEGSAKVILGKTRVLVGVKMELGRPYPDHPNQGTLSTFTDLMPMASPDFEVGPPSPRAIEISRVVDRGIRESGCIDFKGLTVDKGEKVWGINIDIQVLDHDGNLIDAAGIGAIAALTETKVPSTRFDLGEDYGLPIGSLPIPVTVVKLGDAMLVDPGLNEDEVADVRLTVTTDDDGKVRAMQKGQEGSLTVDDVRRAVKLSQRIGKGIRKSI